MMLNIQIMFSNERLQVSRVSEPEVDLRFRRRKSYRRQPFFSLNAKSIGQK